MRKKRPFYSEPISQESKYYKFIIWFFKQNKIAYQVRWKSARFGGHAESDKGKVFLRLGENKKPCSIRMFLSLAFHESSHVLNFRDGKFLEYHTISSSRMTMKRLRAWIRTGVRAEKYTDWRAGKLMKEHFPDIPYCCGYDEEGVANFKRYQIANWRANLEIMEDSHKKRGGVKYNIRSGTFCL